MIFKSYLINCLNFFLPLIISIGRLDCTPLELNFSVSATPTSNTAIKVIKKPSLDQSDQANRESTNSSILNSTTEITILNRTSSLLRAGHVDQVMNHTGLMLPKQQIQNEQLSANKLSNSSFISLKQEVDASSLQFNNQTDRQQEKQKLVKQVDSLKLNLETNHSIKNSTPISPDQVTQSEMSLEEKLNNLKAENNNLLKRTKRRGGRIGGKSGASGTNF